MATMSDEKELEYEQLTDLVSGEIDRQLRTRHDALEGMKAQMAKVLREFEDLTANVSAKRSWMRSVQKTKDIQPTHPKDAIAHPLVTPGNIVNNSSGSIKSRLPRLTIPRPKRRNIHQPAATENRSPDGKIVFDKKLPRVANMEKRSDPVYAMMASQQRQQEHDRAVVRYAQCRSLLFAPSAYDDKSGRDEGIEAPPDMTLDLEFAYSARTGQPWMGSSTTSGGVGSIFHLATASLMTGS
ncbi:hypothetical protein PINS_up015159 [Pythium insidiosum]|nr:hypothetical protein PINS_up015159 [Pythium insidiosum]